MQYISLFFGETIKKMKFVGRPLHIGSSKNKTNKFKGGIVDKNNNFFCNPTTTHSGRRYMYSIVSVTQLFRLHFFVAILIIVYSLICLQI